MYTFLVITLVMSGILLILATLLQQSKKEGLGGILGSTEAGQLIGVQKTSDLLEQITLGLMAFIFIISIATTHFLPTHQTEDLEQSPNIRKGRTKHTQQEKAKNTRQEKEKNTQPVNEGNKKE